MHKKSILPKNCAQQEPLIWNQIDLLENLYHDYEFPKITIIIPTHNCSQSITSTVESILIQDYPSMELIIIDAESMDRTAEVVKRFRDDRITLYSVSEYQRYAMMNKGIALAQGEYLNFLFPGDFYLSRFTLKWVMTLALQNSFPDLIYGGSLLRDGRVEVKILFRDLNLDLLKRGQQPTSLQSCWFKREVFHNLGKFNPRYHLRGGFDFMCRFYSYPEVRVISTSRVLTDYDLRWVGKHLVFRHFWETLCTLYQYFGWTAVLRWLFVQRDMRRFIKLWIRSAKIAFSPKS